MYPEKQTAKIKTAFRNNLIWQSATISYVYDRLSSDFSNINHYTWPNSKTYYDDGFSVSFIRGSKLFIAYCLIPLFLLHV